MWFKRPSDSTLLSALLCVYAVLASTADAALSNPLPASLTNTEIVRDIDLTAPSIRESYEIAVRNDDSAATVEHYYFTVPPSTASTIAWIAAGISAKDATDENLRTKSEKKSKKEPEHTPLTITHDAALSDSAQTVYTIALNPPLAPGDKKVLIVQITHTNKHQRIHPEKVAQDKAQYVRWEGDAHLHSVYPTEWLKTLIRIPSQHTEGYSKKPEPATRDKAGTTFTYGPYQDIPALAPPQPIYVHYEQNAASISVVEHRRELEVSHWGDNLAVEEHYNIRHDGAKLDGEFSRLTYQRIGHMLETTPVLKQIPMVIPASAENLYYRDPIGNVSTSTVNRVRDQKLFTLQPRFPIYGGWQYRYYFGYDLPLHDHLQRVIGTNTYQLNVPFLDMHAGWTFERSTMRILLPEGAHNIKIHMPFELDEKRSGFVRTYLDVTGRTAIWLTKFNAVDEHSRIIEITYDYSTFDLLRKPLGIFVAFMALFVVAMAYARLDLSIARK